MKIRANKEVKKEKKAQTVNHLINNPPAGTPAKTS
jgi:hypothetical protein